MNISKKLILVFIFSIFTLILILVFIFSIFKFQFLPFTPSLDESAEYPLTVIDDTGTAVQIPFIPQRIVSTAPSNTEILFALNLEDKIVGITNYCNFPEETKNIEKIGEISPLNFEKIISLKPDFILAYAGFQLTEIPRLRELGLNALVIEPLSLKETLKTIKMVATICGVPEKGNILLDNLNQRIEKIKTKVDNIEIYKKPKILIGGIYETIWTPGEGTLFNELISMAGGINIASGFSGWTKISQEFIVKENPDIIIIPTGAMNPEDELKIKENISQRPGWSNITAVKAKRIFVVNEDLFFRATPRLVDGLESLYKIFYE
jgi:iron complex transport system substrate-binding protein